MSILPDALFSRGVEIAGGGRGDRLLDILVRG
ncbi:MAG: Fis family transcriptional regulator, partial [Methanoculleus sp.]|nr:Fis family transcriptional regulator [Methanoculleus sp.]